MKFVAYRSLASYSSLVEKANKILEAWGFYEKRDLQIQNLSYGEQRQIELILTLVEEPRLLLLDEPTAGLSRAERSTFEKAIRIIAEDRTIIMIEHNMDVAFGLARRVIVLHEGRLFADGPPDEIRADPRLREIYLGTEEA